MIIIAQPEKPFKRSGNGTIIRRLTAEDYRSEIESLEDKNQR